MAKRPGSVKSPESIGADLVRSRERLERDLQGLRYELDIPRKLKQSFQQQTAVWLGAAVVIGALIMFLPRSPKKVYVETPAKGKGWAREKPKTRLMETGLLLGALRIAATLLRPVVTDIIKEKVAAGFGSARPRSKW